MPNQAVVISDIKALLTLLLLKTGTTSAEIRTSLQFASTWRAVAADDHDSRELASLPPANNVAKLYPNSDAEIAARQNWAAIQAMNSDVMALLTLSLLNSGSSPEEIQQALRLAAMSRAAGTTEDIGTPPDRPALIDSDQVSMALKQALLNELLLVTGAAPEAATV